MLKHGHVLFEQIVVYLRFSHQAITEVDIMCEIDLIWIKLIK